MKKIFPLLVGLVLLASCHRDPHFITDKDYRSEVHGDFEERMAQFPMLDVRLDTLSAMEREAMEFLYAYMPLSDLADYEPQFYLDQVRYAFKAREEMPWGKDIPEDVFRHFVLVYRVNNENLDTARMVMFRELKERVGGMSMEEAALEVNHWCHEHVAYRASDSRTSAPLATMRTSLGRCGEESTFAVTALRAVGIPARQCYTPRWAHCDDNHAWVEVWVAGESGESGESGISGNSGQWKFLGACEPDPRLNMGWFSVPSTRCMMVHSKAFGKYKGDEEVVKRTALYSELNLLSHYAPTRKVTVTVQDEEGKPLKGAQVKFKLYNYAEYYTLSAQTTDADGKASLTTGLGDLLIWVTDGDNYRFRKIDVRKDSVATVKIEKDVIVRQYIEGQGCIDEEDDWVFEMVPPVAGTPKVVATEEETAANAKRLAYEDSLRNAYTATFPSYEQWWEMSDYPVAVHPDVAADKAWELVKKSEGNWREITAFIDTCGDYRREYYEYMSSYSDKDMRDITAATLEAHWTEPWQYKGYARDVYEKGIMPARISNEMVRPYRKELARFKGMTAEEIRQWTLDSIVIDDTSNYYNCPVSPVGVYKLRRADSHSRDIFFVAACRAAGVPAYLDNATNIIYAWDGAWKAVGFAGGSGDSGDSGSSGLSGRLTLVYKGKEPAKPVYWPHFTLAKLENGDLRTFDFENDPRMEWRTVSGERRTDALDLDPGVYCLSTGNRYPDGAVRSRMEFFEVNAGERMTKEIVILPMLARTDELGVVDKNLELFDGVALWDYAGKEGMLYVNLGEYSEPSKHLIVELRQLQKEMAAWGGMTFMVGPTTIGMTGWDLVNTDFAYQKGLLEQRICEAAKLGKVEYPLVALIDKDGHILYHSTGYKIGVVEQVLKATRR
ncbi:MAG: transglutaminase domain-containing protein [Bacteroidales bacterium]|nr:transglutaminase domain-containing protein [Bacteroidales bacterium]